MKLAHRTTEINCTNIISFISVDAELFPGEYFSVKDDRDPSLDHFIQFSMSLRGKPAILGEISFETFKLNFNHVSRYLTADNIRFIVMNENKDRVLWRCSLMSTKTRKCPARIVMAKGNPPQFVMGQCRHEHMELVRGKSTYSTLTFNSFNNSSLSSYRKL